MLAELPVDLVHVAVKLLEQALQAGEHGIERGLVAGKVGANKILKFPGVAVFRAPEFAYLVKAPVKACALGLPVLGDQFGLQLFRGYLGPGGFDRSELRCFNSEWGHSEVLLGSHVCG